MSGQVIAVANMKGGVGKTATVVGLAEALAADGASVLVIDLDPQASASICLAGDDLLSELITDGRTIDAFLDDYLLGGRKRHFSDCIQHKVSDVTHQNRQLPISLLASSPHLRVLEREVMFKLTEQRFGLNAIVGHLSRVMQAELGRTAASYDYVILDCAPGISALTEVSLRISNIVIVPTIPDYLSTYGLQAFCHSVWKGDILKKAKARKLPNVLITRRRATTEQNRTVTKLRNEKTAPEPAFFLFETEVPEAAAIAAALAKAGTNPTFTNKWGTPIVSILNGFVRETKEALNGA